MLFPKTKARLSEIQRPKAAMALSGQSMVRLAFSGLVSVAVYLCALSFLLLPQHALLTFADLVEAECPLQEVGESSQEEQVVRSSARRRLNDRLRRCLTSSRKHHVCSQHNSSSAVRFTAIVGHHLSNGHCAPLLI